MILTQEKRDAWLARGGAFNDNGEPIWTQSQLDRIDKEAEEWLALLKGSDANES